MCRTEYLISEFEYLGLAAALFGNSKNTFAANVTSTPLNTILAPSFVGNPPPRSGDAR